MYTYKFFWKIHSGGWKFDLNIEHMMSLYYPNFWVKGIMKVIIKDSKIYVFFETDIKYTSKEISPLETLKNFIEEDVKVVVDIRCYINSYCYDIEIIKVECKELDLEYIFWVRWEWNINKSNKEIYREFDKIIDLFRESKSYHLKDVFADFSRWIKYPKMTPFFCYRAIETIRKFYFDEKKKKNWWENMRDKLEIEKKEFKEILKFSDDNRHWDYPAITYEEREDIMNFTRKVIDKFIKYSKNKK